MKYYELDKEEQELLDAVERDDFKPVELKQSKKELVAAARAFGNKTRNINIRVSERLLHKLKVKATKEGIPYQTLAASILFREADR